MSRARLGAALVAVAMSGCSADAPPLASPEVSTNASAAAAPSSAAAAPAVLEGKGTKESPYVLPPSGEVRLPVAASREPAGGFRLKEQSDVVLRFEGKSLAYRSPDGISGTCTASPCVIASAMVGTYRIEPAEKQTVEIEALAPLARAPLQEEVTTKLVPKAIAGDPRGRVAEASIEVPAPGAHIKLRYKAVFATPEKPKKKKKFSFGRRAPVQVLGPRHSVMTEMLPQAADGSFEVGFEAGPGQYVFRVAPTPDRPEQDVKSVEVTVASFVPKAPDNVWRARPSAPGPQLPELSGGAKVRVDAVPTAPAAETWLLVEPASDIEWWWARSDVQVMAVGASFSECPTAPCWTDLASGPLSFITSRMDDDTSIDVRVRRLPTPPVTTTLALDKPIEVQTALHTPDDPRGAFYEVAIEVEKGKAYQVTVQAEGDFSGPMLEAARRVPTITLVRGRELRKSIAGGFGHSGDAIRNGIDHEWIEAAATGKMVIRIDGRNRMDPRKVKVTLAAAEPMPELHPLSPELLED